MNPEFSVQHDHLLRRLGASEERVRQLERMAAEQQTRWEGDARQWQRLLRHRRELAEWLVDGATNESRQIVARCLDAGLRGELFVPCSFAATVDGRRYCFDLTKTEYEIRIAHENG